MTHLTKYIPPAIAIDTSFKNLKDRIAKYGSLANMFDDDETVELDDILQQKLAFVVGEPGQGKTRLLNELALIANSKNLNWNKFSLRKRIGNNSLEESIASSGENDEFDISITDDTVIFLDALDEVPSSKFAETVQLLSSYVKKHPDHRIIISSRMHFFTKYESSFAQLNASYLAILPLEREQQKEFLKLSGIGESDISIILQKLRYTSRETIIETPRYLEYFVDWYLQSGHSAEQMSRSDIFNHFVDKSLKNDDESMSNKVAPLKRRTLEKLALVMEIAQTNSITHEEVVSFIDLFKSEAKLILFTALDDLEEFYNHGLIRDDGETISFDNVELQEYLAACSIHRMDKLNIAVFDLAVDRDQRMVHPSWYNTLSFILEMHPELLDQILNLQKPSPDKPGRPEDPDTHKLISGVSAQVIPAEERFSIFKRVIDYYIDNDIHIDFEVSSRLAFYADDIAETYLRERIEPLVEADKHRTIATVVDVIGKMKRIEALDRNQSDYWAEKLVDFALTDFDDEYSVLKRRAIYALEYFSDPSLISRLSSLIEDPEELVRRAYENLCAAIDPNDPGTIEALIVGIRNDNSTEARVSLLEIKSDTALGQLLNAMANDPVFLESIVSHESIFRKEDSQFFKNLNEAWNADLSVAAKQVVIKVFDIDSGYYLDRSDFIKKLVKTIANHDANYFSELLNWGMEADEGRVIFDLQSHLANAMRVSDVELWQSALLRETNDGVKRSLFRIVPLTEIHGNPYSKDILDAARQLFPSEFDAYYDVQNDLQNTHANRVLEEFKTDLVLAKTNKDEVILSRILETFNQQNKRSSFALDEVDAIWDLVKELIFEKYDPATATLELQPVQPDGSRPFTISRFIYLFEAALEFISRTDKNANEYRRKLIALLPFLLNEDTEICLELIGSISPEEANYLLSIYSDGNSGRARFHPNSFVEASKKFRIRGALPILKRFMEESSFDVYLRRSALEASESIQPNEGLLLEVFNKYKDDTTSLNEIARTANSLLILQHNNEDAVKWLIDQIKTSAAKYKERYNGIHTTTALEHELHSGENAKPLSELADPKFITIYLDLLEFSFELLKRGNEWHSYAYYVWKIVKEYFMRLRDNLSFKPLEELELWVVQRSTLPGINYFKEHLVELRRAYAIAINRPRNFNEAIAVANKTHEKERLAVSSHAQLHELVEKAIKERLIPWIEGEARKVLNETHAQKLIRVQLENALMKEGFSPADLKSCHILREPQGLDDKRPDFLIYHGFIGPLVIELKLFSNSDLTGEYAEKSSYKSLQTYMTQYEAERAIFFVLDDELIRKGAYTKKLDRVTKSYTLIDGVSVLGARLPDRKEKTVKSASPKPADSTTGVSP